MHRRYQQWCESEVQRQVLADLANTLREQGDIDESESFIDAMFSSAKGGGDEIGATKRGGPVFPRSLSCAGSNPVMAATEARASSSMALTKGMNQVSLSAAREF